MTQRFSLILDEDHDLFAPVVDAVPSERLMTTLAENLPLALAIQTEKARSELIIAPLLVEVRRLVERRISLFSGVEFSVEPQEGLNGVCDFLFSRSREQLFIRAPVVTIVEAKNENIKAGIAPCGAAMVAAQRFNEREQNGIRDIFGAVTTGNIGKFLKLEGTTLFVDRPEYYVDRVGKILAILLRIVAATFLPADLARKLSQGILFIRTQNVRYINQTARSRSFLTL